MLNFVEYFLKNLLDFLILFMKVDIMNKLSIFLTEIFRISVIMTFSMKVNT